MDISDIEAVSTAVKIGGKTYFLLLPLEQQRVLLQMATGLSENKQLNLFPAPADFRFMSLGELKEDNDG